jgi:hypothetical protein
MQIFIPDELVPVLQDLAWQENRWPKQQAEWLLKQALADAASKAAPQTQDQEVLYAKAR